MAFPDISGQVGAVPFFKVVAGLHFYFWRSVGFSFSHISIVRLLHCLLALAITIGLTHVTYLPVYKRI